MDPAAEKIHWTLLVDIAPVLLLHCSGGALVAVVFTMEAVRLARARELRRLKRTKLRCCPDRDGCNQCLRRGARFLIRAPAEEDEEEEEQSLADAPCCTSCPSPGSRKVADAGNHAPRSNSKSAAAQRPSDRSSGSGGGNDDGICDSGRDGDNGGGV